MNSITRFLSQELVNAIGWTIVHSIWQGSLIAIGTGLLLWILHSKSSKLRYLVTASSLFLVLLLAIATFVYLYQRQMPASTVLTVPSEAPVTHSISVNNQPVVLDINLPAASGFWENLTYYFNQNLPLVVVGWMMGVVLFSLRLIGGLAYAHRLKHYRTCAVTSDWQKRLEYLAGKAGVKKSVNMLESALIKVPVVVGHIKPVILIPIGTLTGLPADQIEIILAHELAHIYRNDYLFNIAQKVIDLLFFYHPAMWWLSATVRTERENCCDDVAVTIAGDSLTFAKALANLQELSPYHPELALAFTGHKNQLFNRINRLLKGKRPDFSFSEGFVAACIIMVSMVLVNLNANAELKSFKDEIINAEIFNKETDLNQNLSMDQTDTDKPGIEPKIPIIDMLENQQLTRIAADQHQRKKEKLAELDTIITNQIIVSDDGKDIVKYRKKDGKIVDMSVNGKTIPEAQYETYLDVLKEYNFEGVQAPVAVTLPEMAIAPAIVGTIDAVSTVVPHVVASVGNAMAAPHVFNLSEGRYTPLMERFKNVSGTFTINYDEADRKYKSITLTTDKGKITELSVNGEKINTIAIDAMVAEVDREGRKFEGGPDFFMNFNGMNWNQDNEDAFHFELPDEEAIESALKKSQEQLEKMWENKEEMMQRLEEQQEQFREQLERQQEVLQEKMEELHNRQHDREEETNEAIADELMRDNLIEDKDSFKLEITDKKMMINGKKQSDEVHQKYVRLLEDIKGITFDEGSSFTYESDNEE